jgi:hypothetical protein
VVVCPVAPFGRSVNGDVGDHPAIDELGLSEFPEQLDVLCPFGGLGFVAA